MYSTTLYEQGQGKERTVRGFEPLVRGLPLPQLLPIRDRLGYQLPVLRPIGGVGQSQGARTCEGATSDRLVANWACTSGREGDFLPQVTRAEGSFSGTHRHLCAAMRSPPGEPSHCGIHPFAIRLSGFTRIQNTCKLCFNKCCLCY